MIYKSFSPYCNDIKNIQNCFIYSAQAVNINEL